MIAEITSKLTLEPYIENDNFLLVKFTFDGEEYKFEEPLIYGIKTCYEMALRIIERIKSHYKLTFIEQDELYKYIYREILIKLSVGE